MSFFGELKTKTKEAWKGFQADRKQAQKDGSLFRVICSWVYKLRSAFLAIPVAFIAVIQALGNLVRLPDTVCFYIPALNNGALMAQAVQVGRLVAVLGPALITGVCLLMMFFSRRIVYPWLISVFTLIVPPAIYFFSVFPG